MTRLRRRIDSIDGRILLLLAARARAVAGVAAVKRERGRPVLDRRREAAILRRARRSRGPLGGRRVERLYAALLAEFRSFEEESGRKRLPAGATARPAGDGALAVSIVGMGLIGGSLGLALRGRTRHRVLAYVRRGTRRHALIRSAAHKWTSDPRRACAADVVVFCAPVEVSVRLVRAWARFARPGSIWTDVGSVKAPICRAAWAALPPGTRFIGGHPMAGSEKSGIAHARADLFEDAAWALTPPAPGSGGGLSRDLAILRALAAAAGARPVVLSPAEHDRAAAFTSHLPQLAASALAAAAGEALGARAGRALAGRGLRDSTRLADSPSAMWEAIAAQNAAPLRAALGRLQGRLRAASRLSRGEISKLFAEARAARRLMRRPDQPHSPGGSPC